ncbi:Protein like [Actinidia chinensis var. chinensis]|uniref:protein-serine/threonine phosphatase n=1 Tax=Actinidia chinensis var. chinensis TaxID=1590841 RepID=A0A2R6P5S5_ACTCC|nr:Protein like [Actinidia chinensis var. chinensis]
MGACYSSIGGRRNAEQEVDDDGDGWWKCKEKGVSKKKSLETKFKRGYSGDFSSFIGKFGGGGGGGGGGAVAEERSLLQIPGRLFGNGNSSIASLYTQQGKKGTNQDAMISWENFNSRSDTIFCGVFDGHGPYGHMVAKKVRDSLPVLLCSQWKANSNSDRNENGNSIRSKNAEEGVEEDWCESLEVEETEKLPEIYLPLKKSILNAFKQMDKDLKFHSTIDCFCSGTTAVALVKQGQDLIIGNVGDSRAVLATRDKDNALTALQLTVDLKPNLPREAARIQQCKGRVFALQDEPEVARVWLPNSDSPGLAMARAFGDFCLKDFGLISVPDVYYHHLTERDEFIVLATDGVWDVLSNKEAVDIVAAAPGRATAARALVDCATRAWRLKYPTSKNDDCAVVCLFLEHVPPPNAAPAENESMKDTEETVKKTSVMNEDTRSADIGAISASYASVIEHSGTIKDSDEIVPVLESSEEKLPEKCLGQSKRSLAECLLTSEDEEWSALEGITRVNSLLSLPRFLSSGDRRSASWRKWL